MLLLSYIGVKCEFYADYQLRMTSKTWKFSLQKCPFCSFVLIWNMLMCILHILVCLLIITVNFSTLIWAIKLWINRRSFWNLIGLTDIVLNVTSMHTFGISAYRNAEYYILCGCSLANILDYSQFCVLMYLLTSVSHMNNGAKSSDIFFLDHKLFELTMNYSMLKRSSFINMSLSNIS